MDKEPETLSQALEELREAWADFKSAVRESLADHWRVLKTFWTGRRPWT